MNFDFSQFGVSGVVIAMLVAALGILGGVIVYLYKSQREERKASQSREDILLGKIGELQDRLVVNAEKNRDEVVEPLKQIAIQQKQMYDQSIINSQRA
jgi:predicted RND superfamily exporter protein